MIRVVVVVVVRAAALFVVAPPPPLSRVWLSRDSGSPGHASSGGSFSLGCGCELCCCCCCVSCECCALGCCWTRPALNSRPPPWCRAAAGTCLVCTTCARPGAARQFESNHRWPSLAYVGCPNQLVGICFCVASGLGVLFFY